MFNAFPKNCCEPHARVGRIIALTERSPGHIAIKGWFMRRVAAALFLIASAAVPAQAQAFNWVNLDRLNGKLCGRVVDYTWNHGADRRIFSPILGRPRDLYVYLPPGYDPGVAYPLIVYLHGAHIDEHAFLDPGVLKTLDLMFSRGEIPPAVIAAPDGTYDGKNRITCSHSLWVNGQGGRFEDHVVGEIVPFLSSTYSLRPERQARSLLGISAGGFGAMTIALKHRDVFGVVATVGGPLNVRYDNRQRNYSDDFDPATYVGRTEYEPDMVIARYYMKMVHRTAREFFEPVYGTGASVSGKVARDNPADVLASANVRPGELAIHVNYPTEDNYNFDAQAQSFVWLAGRRGLAVDVTAVAGAGHDLGYIEKATPPTCAWLGKTLLPPTRR
jgi:poly(3-hydroxybutyrate) depolymerase